MPACYSVLIDLPCHQLGDSYLGVSDVGPVTITPLGETVPVTPSDPLLRVRFEFKRLGRVYTMDSDPAAEPDHLITIINSTTWHVNIGEIADFLPYSGKWSWKAVFYSNYFGTAGKMSLYHGEIDVEN